MKAILKYMFVGLLSCGMFVSCTEDSLETAPTDSMSGTGLLSNANSALVPLNGIYRSMYTAGWTTTDNTHQCFGISAYNLMADVMGEDLIMADQGSGWFWFDCLYNVKPIPPKCGVLMICGMLIIHGYLMQTTFLLQKKRWPVTKLT